ncbi:MAG: hypothetical protein AAB336_09575, partial [Acidobacteriota bacterium]
ERKYREDSTGIEKELEKFSQTCPIYVVNIKPMYRDKIVDEIKSLNNPQINILEVGKSYEF